MSADELTDKAIGVMHEQSEEIIRLQTANRALTNSCKRLLGTIDDIAADRDRFERKRNAEHREAVACHTIMRQVGELCGNKHTLVIDAVGAVVARATTAEAALAAAAPRPPG